MRRSKLEMYIDLLKVLARHGSLKLTHIMYKANINCSVLKQCLGFLVNQNLVEEKTVGKKRIVYGITDRGTIVLKYFRELQAVLPIIEEDQRRIPLSMY